MQALERELARRGSKASLKSFIEFRDAGYRPAQHHRLLIDALEAVERRDIRRLMVCMPPGSAKSTYTSIEFPAWYMGKRQDHSVIAASHTQELAERFGRRVRNIVAGDEFKQVFGFGIAEDSQAAGRWETSLGTEYFAAGVGGSITGRRADLAIIDDPVKSREDADSERARDKAWDWYIADLLTRLKPNAAQILVMTRWHEDDLGGRILERERDQWHVLELPMVCEGPNDPLGRKPGERLWPEWFTDEMVEVAQRDPRNWNALYQQRPAPDEGTFFQREWFKSWDIRPRGLNIYGTSDYAVTDGDGDYTVHRVWGVDADGVLYRLGGWRGQTTSDVWIEELLDLIDEYRPLCWFGEAGVIAKAVQPAIKRRMRERRTFCRLEWLPSIHDKPTRARGFQARAASGQVCFERGADLTEFLQFPAGKHDDEVDMASLIGRALDEAHPGIVVKPEPKRTHDAWEDDMEEESSWKTA